MISGKPIINYTVKFYLVMLAIGSAATSCDKYYSWRETPIAVEINSSHVKIFRHRGHMLLRFDGLASQPMVQRNITRSNPLATGD